MPPSDNRAFLDEDAARSPVRNAILAALPPGDASLLRPHLHRATLVASQVLYEPGVPIDAVYFLESGIASQTADTGDEGRVQVGMTGREGLVGVMSLLNANALCAQHTTMQVAGSALRMQRARFLDVVAQSPSLRAVFLRQIEGLVIQVSQSAACNARHDMTQRLARWLLMAHDRVDGDELPMTQECLARMLGVRRAGVSGVVGLLQKEGLIRQARGRITLVERAGLELKSCACYAIAETARTLVCGA